MEISKIIESGEVLSPEQLAKTSGGVNVQNNTNNATVSCMCSGTGTNMNMGIVCQCNSNLEKNGPNDEKATSKP